MFSYLSQVYLRWFPTGCIAINFSKCFFIRLKLFFFHRISKKWETMPIADSLPWKMLPAPIIIHVALLPRNNKLQWCNYEVPLALMVLTTFTIGFSHKFIAQYNLYTTFHVHEHLTSQLVHTWWLTSRG